ncbi:SRPBCC domain-containing protein [Patescibacteria group bacterium]|nr:SRPBCC domain-containing protein [Patescibacteria group bacterium]
MTDTATVIIKKTFACSPQVLWEAWTDRAQMVQWYGPENHTTEIHEMDFREGGNYRLTMHSDRGQQYRLRGTFITIDQPKKLVMTWQWEEWLNTGIPGPETVVTVDIRSASGGSEMTLTHVLPDAESQTLHDQGWNSSFKKLEKFFGQ